MAEYIDKSVLIAMCKGIAAFNWNKKAAPVSWADAYERFADEVEDFDAADVVEVKRGRWEFGELDIMGTTVKCSCCGWSLKSVDPVLWIAYPAHKFCGSCGADMREVDHA